MKRYYVAMWTKRGRLRIFSTNSFEIAKSMAFLPFIHIVKITDRKTYDLVYYNKNTSFYGGVINMFAYIILIYMVIGIMTVVPFLVVGEEFGNRRIIIIDDGCDGWNMFAIGLGALLCVIIWPYYIGMYVYGAYFEN